MVLCKWCSDLQCDPRILNDNDFRFARGILARAGPVPGQGVQHLDFSEIRDVVDFTFTLGEASPHREFGWELLTALWSLEGAEIALQRR